MLNCRSESGFDVHEAGEQPAVSLAGGGPSFDDSSPLSDLAIDGFDAVGDPEAVIDQWHHAEVVQGEGLFHAFVQVVCRRGLQSGAYDSYRL